MKKLTRQDVGHIGGTTTKKRYGSEHFREIGRKGGEARGKGPKLSWSHTVTGDAKIINEPFIGSPDAQ